MGSRRHLLPAIYNANLERFHWTPEGNRLAEAEVKVEQVDGLIWLNEDQVLEISDSESEFDLDNENELANGNE